jgi:hypothetical protein
MNGRAFQVTAHSPGQVHRITAIETEKALSMQQIAAAKSVEQHLDGPVDKAGGAQDKTGKKEGLTWLEVHPKGWPGGCDRR